MPLLSCQKLSFAYENNIVVSDLNFSVNAGDYLCIVGENGSGKSTLIKGLLGLKQPCTGSIVMGEGLKSAQIGYLPQQTGAQKDFPASVYEVILSGCLNSRGIKPFYGKEQKQYTAETMHLLGIDSYRNHCYRDLSGGQQRRVLLARALCATHKLLLLDEPVAGLDPLVTKEMYQIIAMLNQQRSITVIMISHDIASAIEQSSHILHLRNTQLFFGTKTDYMASQLGKSYLGGAVNG